jgi:hypothetical protein
MALTEIFLGKRAVILERWLQKVLESYPDQSRHFLHQVKDPFANPIGATLSKELAALLDGLLAGSDPVAAAPALDAVIKIRSVQGLTASQAVAFIFKLKQIVREEAEKEIVTSQAAGEMLAFDAKVDDLALSAFDLYAANREKICAIRIDEMKRSLFVIERASRPLDAPGPVPEARIHSDAPKVSIPSGGIIGNEPKP